MEKIFCFAFLLLSIGLVNASVLIDKILPSGQVNIDDVVSFSNNVHPIREKRQADDAEKEIQMVGAVKPLSIDHPDVQYYLTTSLKQYQSEKEPLVVKVKEATVQVVSGLLYKIKVELGTSTCDRIATGSDSSTPASASEASSQCLLDSSKPTKNVVISVWSQPWLNKGEPQVTFEEE